VDRKTCETRFRSDLYRICDATYAPTSPFRYTCRGIAETYYAAVGTFGGAFSKGAGVNDWALGAGCSDCPPKSFPDEMIF